MFVHPNVLLSITSGAYHHMIDHLLQMRGESDGNLVMKDEPVNALSLTIIPLEPSQPVALKIAVLGCFEPRTVTTLPPISSTTTAPVPGRP